MSYYLIFDIGGTGVKYAISNEEAVFEHKGKVKAHQEDFALLLEEVGSVYDKWKKQYQFEGIAISSPGFVDQMNGIVHGFSALPCIHEFPIAKAFSERMGNLPISMENDGNCSALGEYWKGNGRGKKNTVCLVYGSGIGGGYVRNGRIGQTKNFSSSEFGFMPLVSEGGKMLSWSTYSVVNTLKKYNKEQNANLTGEELFDLAETDPIAKLYVDRFYYYMAAGCLNSGYILDPDKILIGGAISKRPNLKERLEQAIRDLKLEDETFTYNNTEVDIAILGNDANLIGALYNFLYCDRCMLGGN